ncbi:MerR family transcriptional regulator [Salsipaludibacter albus]|uniref:MerR family transcriptional regulator n=1 Tax=Salsipaludibacter albus TaxID=2849650 RepID=UPI001EE3F74B|nr:MerR family transcriptional regulator [Salsipaludibacter albus]MBY5162860.1 MerR family transcriptional regulator [Salsipaludibacter albus]
MAGNQLQLDVGDDVAVGYRGPTACNIVGITYRQLDYWARTDLVSPSVQRAEGSGSQRLYSFNDIVALRVVKRLLDAGVSLQRVRLAIETLAAQGHSPADVTVVSDGTNVFMVDDDQEVVELVMGGQGVFAIALGPVIEELEGEVTAFPTERAQPINPPTGLDDSAEA